VRVLLKQVRGRKKSPRWTEIAKETERSMESTVKPRILGYAEKIVANWEHKPQFKARKSVGRGGIVLYVYPTGPNAVYWIWTSRGTKKHKIRPKTQRRFAAGAPEGRGGQFRKRAKLLAFPTGYVPKTTPRGPGYGGPGTATGPTVFAVEVDHPGTKARHFEEAWARWAKTWFRREIENAMRRGAKRT
jgi:hypothetical protein